MKKQSTITNLLVIPLIASAVFLASPALAYNNAQTSPNEVRHKTGRETTPKKSIIGSVTAINGDIVIVTTKSDIQYTVDTSNATIMKASEESNHNPSIVTIANIEVGDAIAVRGTIDNTEIEASKIFDGKMPKIARKHHKHLRHEL